MRDAFIETLEGLAAADPRIFLITGDLGFRVLDSFIQKFPRQFLNVGIAEQNMTGIATGLALEGRIVFTYSIANFPTLRCLEQIRNDACYHGANVNIVSIGAGFSYGQLGISHHATEDISIMRALPDLTILSPADDWESRESTKYLVSKRGTGYLRLDRAGAQVARDQGEVFIPSKLRRIRTGKALTFISTGGILANVIEAAELLQKEGIDAGILNAHTLKPFDYESTIQAARESGGIITVEEHSVEGGLGGIVAECLLESGHYPGFFRRIGLRAGFSSIVGDQDYLRAQYRLDAVSIANEVLELVKNRSDR